MDGICLLYAISDSQMLTYPIILNKNKPVEKIMNINSGNIFMINNKIHIITCFHCVKNTREQYIVIDNNEYRCKIKCVSDELELACLEILDYESKKQTYFTLNDLSTDLESVNKNVTINSYNIDDYCINKKLNRLNINCTIMELLDSQRDSTKSINMPIMPRYLVKLGREFSDIDELSGLSGSIVINNENNKIIGIVSAVENSLINVIPSGILLRFLNEIKLTNNFIGLCSLVGKFTECNFTKEDSNERVYGYIVDNTYDINYNNYGYKLQNQVYMNLRKGDIIIEVNDIKLDNRFKLYDNQVKYNLDLTTYIALNFMCGEKIPIKIMRSKKNNPHDYKEKKIIIFSRPLHSMRYISLTFNNDIVNIEGFIFVELSEDIINNYMNMGIYIGKSFAEYYLINPYRNNNESVIILLDIDKTNIDNNIKNVINEAGFPLIHISERLYGMAMISKVNKKKINTISEFKEITNSLQDLSIQLIVKSSKQDLATNFKMNVSNKKVVTLKKLE